MRKKICNKCNTENPDEAIFCRHCGKRFGNKSADSSERMGYLSVQSTPSSALVWIDQVKRGQTPLKVSLREGEHRVYIAINGQTTGQDVYVRRNETSFVTAHLDSGQSKQIHSTGKIFGQSSHDRSGIIDIRCQPVRVAVKIDNKYIGMTPVKASVAEGTHKVYLSNAGRHRELSVNVRRGEVAYVNENLTGNVNKNTAPSTSNKQKSSNNSGCFWLTIFLVICTIAIGGWLYYHYYGGNIPFIDSYNDIEAIDSIAVGDDKSSISMRISAAIMFCTYWQSRHRY